MLNNMSSKRGHYRKYAESGYNSKLTYSSRQRKRKIAVSKINILNICHFILYK